MADKIRQPRFWILSILVFFNSIFAFSEDYERIDLQSKSIPSELRTIDQITNHLTKNSLTKKEKVRAIYIWISYNIKYDLELLKSVGSTTDKTPENLISDVLEKRKGVCAHYAHLFHAMCMSSGIKSYFVSGYTRDEDGKIANVSHAWNAVFIDDKFYQIDATWAAGYFQDNKYVHQFRDLYFLIKPSEFIKTHIPFDPIWQFLENPLSSKDIQLANWTKLKSKGNYNYVDSIGVSENLPNIEKYIRIRNRIVKSGITNDLIQEQVSYFQTLIANEKYNNSVDKLNDAVNRYNKSVENYNRYVVNKNTQLKNGASLSELSYTLLTDAKKDLEQAEQIRSMINFDDKLLNNKVSKLQQSISELTANINNEDKFMKNYRKKPKPFNVFSFLKSLFQKE